MTIQGVARLLVLAKKQVRLPVSKERRDARQCAGAPSLPWRWEVKRTQSLVIGMRQDWNERRYEY